MRQPYFIFVLKLTISIFIAMRRKNTQTELNKDRAVGCLVGGAVGDALGYAVEFEQWPYICNTYGDRGITRYELSHQGKALISDDTQMTLFTASGILLGMTRGCTRGIMGRIDMYCGHTYVDWLHTQEWLERDQNHYSTSWLMDIPELYARRAPGNTCLSALKTIEKHEAPRNNSCGCGGVMRTAPLAILDYIHGYADGDYKYCNMVAAEAARITHKHPLGFLPSAVLNDILMQIFECDEVCPGRLSDYVQAALNRLPSIVSEDDGGKTYGELWPKDVAKLQDVVKQAIALVTSEYPDHVAIEKIGGGWTGHEALAIAIYCALKYNESFEDAIVCAVNHSGDSDSTGAICGNIMGALLGRTAIPEFYTKDLELLDVIEEMADDLYTGCIISEYSELDTPEEIRWSKKYCEHTWMPKRQMSI